MKIYSHRGNLEGPNPERENDPDYILEALQEKFPVEVDCWWNDGDLWFGHDGPQYKAKADFIQQHKYMMILHANNFDAVRWLRNRDVHYFWHDTDAYTTTSWLWTWMYPSNENLYDEFTIMAVPEMVNLFDRHMLPHGENIGGVCTDYPYNWKVK